MPIFRYPFFYNPNYSNYYNRYNHPQFNKNTINNNYDFVRENSKFVLQEDSSKKIGDVHKENKNEQKNNSKEQSHENYFFELFGLKLYFDDILLICLIFFLYQEGVKDDELFISLILLLLS